MLPSLQCASRENIRALPSGAQVRPEILTGLEAYEFRRKRQSTIAVVTMVALARYAALILSVYSFKCLHSLSLCEWLLPISIIPREKLREDLCG